MVLVFAYNTHGINVSPTPIQNLVFLQTSIKVYFYDIFDEVKVTFVW